MQGVMEQTVSNFGKLDVLVNCAGIGVAIQTCVMGSAVRRSDTPLRAVTTRRRIRRIHWRSSSAC